MLQSTFNKDINSTANTFYFEAKRPGDKILAPQKNTYPHQLTARENCCKIHFINVIQRNCFFCSVNHDKRYINAPFVSNISYLCFSIIFVAAIP